MKEMMKLGAKCGFRLRRPSGSWFPSIISNCACMASSGLEYCLQHKFSQVSILVHLTSKGTIESTFENVLPDCAPKKRESYQGVPSEDEEEYDEKVVQVHPGAREGEIEQAHPILERAELEQQHYLKTKIKKRKVQVKRKE